MAGPATLQLPTSLLISHADELTGVTRQAQDLGFGSGEASSRVLCNWYNGVVSVYALEGSQVAIVQQPDGKRFALSRPGFLVGLNEQDGAAQISMIPSSLVRGAQLFEGVQAPVDLSQVILEFGPFAFVGKEELPSDETTNALISQIEAAQFVNDLWDMLDLNAPADALKALAKIEAKGRALGLDDFAAKLFEKVVGECKTETGALLKVFEHKNELSHAVKLAYRYVLENQRASAVYQAATEFLRYFNEQRLVADELNQVILDLQIALEEGAATSIKSGQIPAELAKAFRVFRIFYVDTQGPNLKKDVPAHLGDSLAAIALDYIDVNLLSEENAKLIGPLLAMASADQVLERIATKLEAARNALESQGTSEKLSGFFGLIYFAARGESEQVLDFAIKHMDQEILPAEKLRLLSLIVGQYQDEIRANYLVDQSRDSYWARLERADDVSLDERIRALTIDPKTRTYLTELRAMMASLRSFVEGE